MPVDNEAGAEQALLSIKTLTLLDLFEHMLAG